MVALREIAFQKWIPNVYSLVLITFWYVFDQIDFSFSHATENTITGLFGPNIFSGLRYSFKIWININKQTKIIKSRDNFMILGHIFSPRPRKVAVKNRPGVNGCCVHNLNLERWKNRWHIAGFFPWKFLIRAYGVFQYFKFHPTSYVKATQGNSFWRKSIKEENDDF